MTSNVWGNCGDQPIANRDDKLADVFLRYRPDILGLQEVSAKVRREQVSIFDLLDSQYAEVAVDIEPRSNNYTPLLYLKEKFTVLRCGFHCYSGLNDSNSKSVTWAVFACKSSGNRFAVCNTHFYWKDDDAGKEARISNSKELVDVVAAIMPIRQIPVLCMGDFNCRASSDPIRILLDNGFADARSTATVRTSDSNAHHPYPEWDEALQIFANGPAPTGEYAQAIDHIFYAVGTASIFVYETIVCQDALDASDHCPVYVDLSFREVAATSPPIASLAPEALHICWMTDLHLVDAVAGQPQAEGAIRGNRHYYAAKQKLRQAVDTINKEQPDFVICTGDITDRVQPLASFQEEWERIVAPKDLVIGNHDLDNGYRSLVEQLGYATRPVVAGSVFNRSLSLRKGALRVRLLLLDTNIGEDGAHRVGTSEGALQEEAIAWLEQEMRTCPEALVLLFSHHGMAGPTKYFHQPDVARYYAMVDRVAEAKPELRLLHCAGHHHVHPLAEIQVRTPYDSFINGVAMISESRSFMHVLSIAQEGTWTLSYRELRTEGDDG
jgi:endonuclease/exonuclease/phosphatase family metal-dependent hydrolase